MTDQKNWSPHLERLVEEQRSLNRTVDTRRSLGGKMGLKTLKRLRVRLKDSIVRARVAPVAVRVRP